MSSSDQQFPSDHQGDDDQQYNDQNDDVNNEEGFDEDQDQLSTGGFDEDQDQDQHSGFDDEQDQLQEHIPNRSYRQNRRTSSYGSADRDLKLAELENERKASLIKAWEDSKKSKAVNKAEKKISDVQGWENRKKADVREKMAKFDQRMKDKIIEIHKEAEDRRAVVKATKEKEILEVEEMAAKYRASGLVPKASRKCFF